MARSPGNGTGGCGKELGGGGKWWHKDNATNQCTATVAGTANTGGGGGGGVSNCKSGAEGGSGAAGGSGIVIIRYKFQ